MINQLDQPADTSVTCIDAPSQDYARLRNGAPYRIEYWDGCCIHVTDDAGNGATLNRDRFAPLISDKGLGKIMLAVIPEQGPTQ
jgi:hypothetical protein